MPRSLAIIGLVLLILLLAIPLGVGMVMTGACPECHAPGALGSWVALCFAVLGSLMIVFLAIGGFALVAPTTSRVLLQARSLERPPRSLAFA